MLRLIAVFVGILGLAGCISAPVQEMSDARQAIAAARVAGATEKTSPEFYAAQAMRLPTFGKPRIISCAELFPKHVALPRGCLDDLLSLLREVGVVVGLRDERQQGQPTEARFVGELRPEPVSYTHLTLPTIYSV